MIKLLTILLTTLTACGSEPRQHAEPTPYQDLIPAVQDQSGFIESDHCDSLLFSGLLGATGIDVELTAARADDGQWYRRPDKSCLSNGESKSSISRDMLLGLLWWAWRGDQLDVIQDLRKYAAENQGILGDHDGSIEGRSRVLLSPQLAATIAKLEYELGGANSVAAHAPAVWSYQTPGYQRHLQVLHMLLRAELDGQMSALEGRLIDKYVAEEPLNILWQAAAIKYRGASRGMYDFSVARYPQGRLPTSADWCSEWPVQRASGSNGQQPCPAEGRTHSGGELLFAASILNGKR